MPGNDEETVWGYATALRVFSDMMDRQDSLSDLERNVFTSLGDYLVWYEKTFMPIPPASRAATPAEMAEYEATKLGELDESGRFILDARAATGMTSYRVESDRIDGAASEANANQSTEPIAVSTK